MILDLHVHTDLSGDAKPTIEEYARWAMELRNQFSIDGFAVTEHRYYSVERNRIIRELSKRTGIAIFQGVELETDYGHLLIYGVNPAFLDRVDISQRTDGRKAVQFAIEMGCVPVPAHPCRPMLGCGTAVSQLPGIRTIEQLNGANDRSENRGAEAIAKSLNLYGTGGSDAHFIGDFGLCLTRFSHKFSTERELVRELLKGDYQAIFLEEARHL